VPHAAPASLASRLLWLAVVWLALAWREVVPALFAASQAALAGAVLFAVAALLQRQGWYASAPRPWLDPWSLQVQALALGGLCLGWIGVRLGVRAWIGGRAEPPAAAVTAGRLLDPAWPAFDRFLRGAVVVALVALAVYGVVPGVAQELTPRDLAARLAGVAGAGSGRVVPPAGAFEIAGVPHGHALGLGSWACWAWRWPCSWRASGSGSGGSTCSAPWWWRRWPRRWRRGGGRRTSRRPRRCGGPARSPCWGRRPGLGPRGARRWAVRLGWRIEPGDVAGLERLAAGTALALALLPLAAFGGYVGVAALLDRAPAPELSRLWGEAGALFVALAAVALGLRSVEARAGRRGRGVAGLAAPGASLLVLMGMLPLVAVTAFVVVSALAGNPIVGPEPGSAFARLGKAGSYVPPVLVLAATLVGYAARERSSPFAFAAGLVLAGPRRPATCYPSSEAA
jgi:hypothetical protein